MNKQIELKDLKKYSREYNKKRDLKLESKLKNENLRKVCLNENVYNENKFEFNFDLGDSKISCQYSTKLCWLYAVLNFLKSNVADNLQIDRKNFLLSYSYLAFFDKLEKSNYLYQSIIDLPKDNYLTFSDFYNSRKLIDYLEEPFRENGSALFAFHLIKKYGLVPFDAMPETISFKQPDDFLKIYIQKLRYDVYKIIKAKAENKDLYSLKDKMLKENYKILSMILGEPPQSFDYIYRNKDEKIITLDGVERNLDEDMLVIADNKKAVAIAGVMGGENSEIEKDTKTLVFEAAVFNRGSVRKTAKQVGLRTESSSRFEKGLSTENALRAINRAVELVELLGIGEPVSGKIDVYPEKQKTNTIPLDPDRINRLLGIDLSKEEMVSILEKLEMKVEDNKVIPPYFRLDIEQEADIAEEILRFYGYDKLGSTLADSNATIGIRTKLQKIEKDVRNLLVHSGMQEIYTYGFINEKDLEKTGETELISSSIKIRNPLNEDYTIMRQTTIPSILSTLALNDSKKNKEVKLFDISRTYKNLNNAIENGNVPVEEKVITLGMYGKETDFYVLKGMIENILYTANIARYKRKQYIPSRKMC